VVLLVGWLLAKAVEGLVTRGLRLVRFNQVAARLWAEWYARRGRLADAARAQPALRVEPQPGSDEGSAGRPRAG
jgi:hypothetical protein